ncbi:MAG TPA: Ig-like domain-containing protein [Gemmatimonadales bacterium]|nr:Ig-like domain-containing protein [Gemmatimonadales bacterium]
MNRVLLCAIAASGAWSAACRNSGAPPPPPPEGRLIASPPWGSIEAGDTITGDTMRLTLFTDSGVPVPAGSITWSSNNSGVAQVGATGLVRGLHPGAATIHAVAASAQASMQVTVTDPVLIGAGDMGTCASTNDEATARVLDSLSGTVFTAGDNDYRDATPAPAYGVCFDSTWGRHKWRVRPAAGDDDSLAGYYGYFGAAAHAPTGYYSYDLGTWHVIVLNSAVAVDSTQAQWLRADLAAHPALCTVAISHRPRFSSGNAGNSPGQSTYFQALDDAGAELILDGNDHDYEQFAAQRADGTLDPDGLVEIVVGTGGKSHGRINLPLAANSVVQNADTYGMLRLVLHATGYDWRFIPVAGRTFTDSGSGTCH